MRQPQARYRYTVTTGRDGWERPIARFIRSRDARAYCDWRAERGR